MDSRYNIRVYALLIENNRVLVTDEHRNGFSFTKFPGGGLEKNEGLLDALYREIKEELGIEVESATHFYTTDYFQPSAFNPAQQVISVYYRIHSPESHKIPVKKTPFDFGTVKEGALLFRWIDLSELNPSDFHFPIDKKVAGMLKNM